MDCFLTHTFRSADTATANVIMAATVGIVTPTAAETVP
jgi:hypothetical protein